MKRRVKSEFMHDSLMGCQRTRYEQRASGAVLVEVPTAVVDEHDETSAVLEHDAAGLCGWCTIGKRHSQALHDECLRAASKPCRMPRAVGS
jgi:hypothetical protein